MQFEIPSNSGALLLRAYSMMLLNSCFLISSICKGSEYS